MWQADGRSGNDYELGRHSLGTKDKAEAMENLNRLDKHQAIQNGLIEQIDLRQGSSVSLPLAEGVSIYMKHVCRTKVLGGTSKSTQKIYRSVFDKFLKFAKNRGITSWLGVTKQVIMDYITHLENSGYKYRRLCLEATTIKAAFNHLVRQKMIPSEVNFTLETKNADGSPTYCPSREEVQAMIQCCFKVPKHCWLGRVLMTLAMTGTRVGELVQLTWSDLDTDTWHMHIRDDSLGGGDSGKTIKGAKGRVIPIHEALREDLSSRKGKGNELVFTGPRGGRLKPDFVLRKLKQFVLPTVAKQLYPDEAEPQVLKLTVHGLRHYFCTVCFRHGLEEH